MSSNITAEQWPMVKDLWFAVQDAPIEHRAAMLSDPRIDADIRAHVERLMAAAENVGDRFETPASRVLQHDVVMAPSLVGRRLGAYDVTRRIGQGGMGVVYEAVRADSSYDQRVAVKTIWRGADSTVLLKRFRTERQILAGLQHPNIARLLDGGATEEGTPWLAMEYVDGVPIDTFCDDGRLSLDARLDLFRQVCDAVHFAHRNNVVHRDLKPSNVLVTADGNVKLLDFGVAKLLDDPRMEGTLTGAGLSPFTAAYAAPEQVAGGAITAATDVYALGALLMTLLVGRPPLLLQSMAMADLLNAIRDRPARAPSVLAMDGDGDTTSHAALDEIAKERGFTSRDRLAKALHGELDAIALMALRKEPERRYPSAEAMRADVHRYLRHQQVEARPDTVSYRVQSFARRRWPLVAAALIAASALLFSAVMSWRQSRRAAEEHLIAMDRLKEVRAMASLLVFDANDRLQDVPGATATRSVMMKTALSALDRALTDAPLDPDLLRELAMAYQRAGDLLGNPTNANLGDMVGARAAYTKAMTAAEALMRESPDSVTSAWTLALVYEKAADVEAPSGEVRQALAHQRASLALFRKVAATDTNRLRYLRAVGISSMKLGDLLGHPTFTNTGDTASAIAAYDDANAHLERAAARGDTTYALARHRAIIRERLGRLMQERGDFPTAARWLQQSLALRDTLVLTHPKSVDARRDVAIGLYLLCGLHLAEKRSDLAAPPCNRSLAIRKVLLEEDSSDTRFVRGMGIIHRRMGELRMLEKRYPLALAEYEESLAFYDRFFAGRTGPINDRRDYAYALAERADIAALTGAQALAKRSLDAAAASLDSIATKGTLSRADSALLLRARPAGR
ncbi:MAG: protein kinase [Gemmatimonadaceae bacterium]|nr:protein kinase [Gemmatimonadaceae bacterium]